MVQHPSGWDDGRPDGRKHARLGRARVMTRVLMQPGGAVDPSIDIGFIPLLTYITLPPSLSSPSSLTSFLQQNTRIDIAIMARKSKAIVFTDFDGKPS